MLLAPDGNFIKNQGRSCRAFESKYDNWIKKYCGNREFLTTAVNYPVRQ